MTLTNQVLQGQPSSSHIRLQGLSEIEVAAQLSKGLGNSMPVQVSRSYFQIVHENVFNSINTILFLLGIALVLLGQVGDTVYSGSFCVTGSAYYQAEKVGMHSVASQLTAGARAFRRVYTPLQKQINLVIRCLLLIAVFLEVLLLISVVIFRLVQDVPLVEVVKMSVVILGIVPIGLFLATTVSYSLGAVRIARKGTLVQQANAIESLSLMLSARDNASVTECTVSSSSF